MLLTLPGGDAPLTVETALLDARAQVRPPEPMGVRLGPTTLSHALLTFISEGSNGITRRGESVTLHAGDAMLLWPGEEFRALIEPNRVFRVVNLVFDWPADAPRAMLPEVVRASEDTAELRRATEACAHNLESGRGALAEVEFAVALLALVRVGLWRREAALSLPVRRALDRVRRHPERPFRRDEIAAIAGVSPSHLSHLVKRETGASLSSHIQRARIARARELIHDTSLNFSEIARALDMDLPRLSRLFKQITGASPRAYARAARSDVF